MREFTEANYGVAMKGLITSISCCTAASALVGCVLITDHEEIGGRPRLDSLRFAVPELHSNQALAVRARVASGEDLSGADFIPLTVSSTSGGSVAARLQWKLCEDSRGRLVACRKVTVSLHKGRNLSEIDSLLTELDAQFIRFWLFPDLYGEGGTLYVFEGDPEEAVDVLAQHPAVSIVDLNTVFFPAGGGEVSTIIAEAFIRVADSPSSGSLRLASGAVITAEYTQPDGSVLVATGQVR